MEWPGREQPKRPKARLVNGKRKYWALRIIDRKEEDVEFTLHGLKKRTKRKNSTKRRKNQFPLCLHRRTRDDESVLGTMLPLVQV